MRRERKRKTEDPHQTHIYTAERKYKSELLFLAILVEIFVYCCLSLVLKMLNLFVAGRWIFLFSSCFRHFFSLIRMTVEVYAVIYFFLCAFSSFILLLSFAFFSFLFFIFLFFLRVQIHTISQRGTKSDSQKQRTA